MEGLAVETPNRPPTPPECHAPHPDFDVHMECWTCATCWHTFECNWNPDRLAYDVVKPVGRTSSEHACDTCRARLVFWNALKGRKPSDRDRTPDAEPVAPRDDTGTGIPGVHYA